MLQSQLCKQCMCIRHDLECDGYTLIHIDKLPSVRYYYYKHKNGNRFAVCLDLNAMRITVYKNAKLHNIIK